MGEGALRAAKTVLKTPRTIPTKRTMNFLFLRIRQYSLRLISYWANYSYPSRRLFGFVVLQVRVVCVIILKLTRIENQVEQRCHIDDPVINVCDQHPWNIHKIPVLESNVL